MLVLTRRTQERIVITLDDGKRVVVEVLAVERGEVKLGFLADPAVRIDRVEVAERRDQAARAAGGSPP